MKTVLVRNIFFRYISTLSQLNLSSDSSSSSSCRMVVWGDLTQLDLNTCPDIKKTPGIGVTVPDLKSPPGRRHAEANAGHTDLER